jgi:hypothetical protein
VRRRPARAARVDPSAGAGEQQRLGGSGRGPAGPHLVHPAAHGGQPGLLAGQPQLRLPLRAALGAVEQQLAQRRVAQRGHAAAPHLRPQRGAQLLPLAPGAKHLRGGPGARRRLGRCARRGGRSARRAPGCSTPAHLLLQPRHGILAGRRRVRSLVRRVGARHVVVVVLQLWQRHADRAARAAAAVCVRGGGGGEARGVVLGWGAAEPGTGRSCSRRSPGELGLLQQAGPQAEDVAAGGLPRVRGRPRRHLASMAIPSRTRSRYRAHHDRHGHARGGSPAVLGLAAAMRAVAPVRCALDPRHPRARLRGGQAYGGQAGRGGRAGDNSRSPAASRHRIAQHCPQLPAARPLLANPTPLPRQPRADRPRLVRRRPLRPAN